MKQLIFVFIGSLVMASAGLAAEGERVLGTSGDWEAVLLAPSFSELAGACIIRSVSTIKGGRRTRPEIRIKSAPFEFVLAPEKYLAGVLTALAVQKNRSNRALPKRQLVHELKIDDGPITRHVVNRPNDGRWTPSQNMSNARRFVDEMSVGQKLLYQWKLDRAGKTYAYDLAGFPMALKLVSSDSQCTR